MHERLLGIFRRFKPRPETAQDHVEHNVYQQALVRKAKEARTGITLSTPARSGNSTFDVLPDVLKAANRNLQIRFILFTTQDGIDPQTLKALLRLTDMAEIRGRAEIEYRPRALSY